jgi:2-hydroxy-6-oxonona-2,4-dienedioate hydrolase
MTLSAGSPREAEDILARIEAQAVRRDLASQNGPVVWRVWGSGPPVLLLHGSHGAWSHWARNIEALASWRTVIVPDIPGFGESALPPNPDDASSFGEELARGLSAIVGSDAAVDIVGFSTGGLMGAHLAALAPDSVRRLILVDPGGLGTEVGDYQSFAVRGLSGEALRQAHRGNLASMMLHEPAEIDELALLIQSRNAPLTRAYARPLVLPDRLLEVLSRVRAPIDLIWGEHDALHPDGARHQAIVQGIDPQCSLSIIPAAGHWVMFEAAEAFNATLRALLLDPPRRLRP